jgi:hypothetical protein
VFCVINLPRVGVCAMAGSILRRYLAKPWWQQAFCRAMV